MTIIIITLKLVASFFLYCTLYVGILKADKKNHDDKEFPWPDYITGFLFTVGSIWGFYTLWW